MLESVGINTGLYFLRKDARCHNLCQKITSAPVVSFVIKGKVDSNCCVYSISIITATDCTANSLTQILIFQQLYDALKSELTDQL